MALVFEPLGALPLLLQQRRVASVQVQQQETPPPPSDDVQREQAPTPTLPTSTFPVQTAPAPTTPLAPSVLVTEQFVPKEKSFFEKHGMLIALGVVGAGIGTYFLLGPRILTRQ